MAEYNLGRIAFVDKGAYLAEETYSKWDFVTTEDSTYLFIGLAPQLGKPVTDTSFWKCIADGKPATLAAAAADSAKEAANSAAALATDKAALVDSAATLANTKAGLADAAAILATDKAALADSKATLANDKADLAQSAADNANAKAAEVTAAIQSMTLAEELYSYGVSFDITAASPACTRIGHMPFHASKPVHAEMKGCLVNSSNGTVNNYLTNWSDFNLTGADGDVMVQLPLSYWKFGLNSNIFSSRTSKYPIQGYSRVDKHYHAAYEASLNRLTNTLHSVANTTVDFRGGNNTAAWDGTYRSQLGLPATSKSRIDFQAAARAKDPTSTIWNITDFTRWNIVTWLAIIEYGTRDLQQAVNPALDANGYSQGGLGAGVTNIDGDKWGNFNGYTPFIPCGYTNSLNNGTGQVAFTMPFEYDANGAANYAGVYNAETAYTANQFVSSGALLYKCILNAPAGTALTNTTYYTAQTRTVTYPNRYRGIELPFGHIWKWIEGINIKIQSVADGGRSEVYVTDNPANYTHLNYTNYVFKGLMTRTDGYINKMILGETGLLVASEVGGTAGANAMWCDLSYTNIPATGTDLRGVLVGGGANVGAAAGFVYAGSSAGPSFAGLNVGARLCLIP